LDKKIIPIIICMLFLTPLIANAQNIIKEKSSETTSLYDESAPIWSVDDSWAYNVDFTGGILDALDFELNSNNLMLTVDSETTSSYNMIVTGDLTGEISINKLQIIKGKITDTTISGDAIYSKSGIGIEDVDVQISGKFQLIPGTFIIDITLSFTPAYGSINWPLNVGKQWNIPVSYMQGKLDLIYAGQQIFDDLDIPNVLGGQPVKCTSIESKTVTAGTFDAYKIEGVYEEIEIYYASTAGNIINVHAVSDDYSLDMDLKSFTYSGGGEPGAPNKPSKPSGSTTGKPGTSYEYSTSTTDNEGDQVYYWFDWGDGTNSGWIGPKNSGETCKASHSWSKGSYKIKVKAKDTGDHVSVWSDTLDIKIQTSKNKFLYNHFLFTKIIQHLILNYPMLRFFLKK